MPDQANAANSADHQHSSIMWVVSAVVLIIWLVLKFVLHKGGYVHILLLFSISVFVVQLIAYRKTRYHATSSERNGSVN